MGGQSAAGAADLDVRGSVAGSSRLTELPDVVVLDRTDLEALTGYVDRGELKPIIEHTHPLKAVQEAHRAVESRGKHVIDLTQ